MGLPARRLTELKTWRGPTRSSSSTGGTMTTIIRRLREWRRKPGLLGAEAMLHTLCGRIGAFASGTRAMADFDASMSQIDVSSPIGWLSECCGLRPIESLAVVERPDPFTGPGQISVEFRAFS